MIDRKEEKGGGKGEKRERRGRIFGREERKGENRTRWTINENNTTEEKKSDN